MKINLAEQEKRDAIKCLEAGKSLSEKYRFLLFKDKQADMERQQTYPFKFEKQSNKGGD